MRSGCLLVCAALATLVAGPAGPVRAENAAIPGPLTEELPTLKCLGVRWLIGGDENRNAKVHVEYRKAGGEWKTALDLFRVDTEGIRKPVRPTRGQTLHAGSIFGLDEDTEYEVKLSLKDPDGGGTEKLLRMKTWTEPQLPTGGRTIGVQPGELEKALSAAQPGDILRLHKGVYKGTLRAKAGAPGKPIALVGAGDGEAVLDGEGAGNIINGAGVSHVMLEGLSFRNAHWAIAFNGGSYITVRRCRITACEYGFVAQTDGRSQVRIFIADNVMVGPCTWPRTKGIEDPRGVQISGMGHVVCYNRVSGFADAIDTFSTYPCAAIDVYGNEISECTDDGIEMDYSEHNTRCFLNRLTNVFQGISVQPVFGGPIYIFRNVLYNVGLEIIKMHNGPSGVLIFHNTAVRCGVPLVLWTREPVSNSVYRNNLFIGTTGNYAYETTAPMRDCDFDYDGFGGTWKMFLKWNGVRYATLEDVRANAPVYRHVIRVNPATLFRSGVQPPADEKQQFAPSLNDLRLREGSDAVDAGVPLANVNDGYAGKAPDLGAYELGQELPQYGPRPVAPKK